MMMTESEVLTPRRYGPAWSWKKAYIAPPTPATKALTTSAPILCRVVLIPAASQATSSPRIPRRRIPHGEAASVTSAPVARTRNASDA